MMAGGRKAIAWARDGALRFSLTASCQDQNGRSPAERSFSLELEIVDQNLPSLCWRARTLRQSKKAWRASTSRRHIRAF